MAGSGKPETRGVVDPVPSARRWEVRGRVQGVGFRYFVRRLARGLELSGWVANRADGSVEVAAAGSPPALAELEARLGEGPALARVDAVRSVWTGDDPGWTGFEIR